MEKTIDIDYEVVRYNEELGNSILELKIKGKSINYIIINTIRRTILSNIPIYAFNDFNFTVNESIFNNNYMKLRLKNIPVWGISNTIDKFTQEIKPQMNNVLEEDGLNDVPIDDDIDLENDSNVNTSSLNQLTMYVDYKNTENTIITVTTNEAKFYHSNINIQNPYPVAIPLIKLQPNQSINFSAITVLGIEKENSIYSLKKKAPACTSSILKLKPPPSPSHRPHCHPHYKNNTKSPSLISIKTIK